MFSPEDKLFMLYLMTNPHTTQLGIYSLNKKIMAFELGYSVDAISVLIDRFETKYDIIRFSKETNEIALKNSLRHSIVKGGRPVEDLLLKEIKQVKNKSLLKFVYDGISNDENLNKTVEVILEKLKNDYEKDNDNDNDNDNDVSYHDSYHDSYNDSSKPYKTIVDYLNEKADKKYRANNKATQKHINARLKEGYTVEDFKIVIDKKCAEWKNTEMEQYLRPETLFGTKFEGYLNSKATSGNAKPQAQTKQQGTGNIFLDMLNERQGKGDIDYDG
jgi:uncharacterized phage protein (TIGR02220 family)